MNAVEPCTTEVKVDRRQLRVVLDDGREVAVPLSFYPTLERASKKQRETWELIGGGYAIHWPLLDYQLLTEGILLGIHEHFPPPPAEGEPEPVPIYVVERAERGWSVVQEQKTAALIRPTQREALALAKDLARAHRQKRVFLRMGHGKGKTLRTILVEKDGGEVP